MPHRTSRAVGPRSTSPQFDENAMRMAKDNKWAFIRPAHPGLMWTSLHMTTGQVHALTEDNEVIDIPASATTFALHSLRIAPEGALSDDRRTSRESHQKERFHARV